MYLFKLKSSSKTQLIQHKNKQGRNNSIDSKLDHTLVSNLWHLWQLCHVTKSFILVTLNRYLIGLIISLLIIELILRVDWFIYQVLNKQLLATVKKQQENNNPRASTIVAPVFALPKMFAEWPFPLIGRTSFSDQAFSWYPFQAWIIIFLTVSRFSRTAGSLGLPFKWFSLCHLTVQSNGSITTGETLKASTWKPALV